VNALKLTSHFGERSRLHGRLLADDLLDIQGRHQIRASILLRGIQGFGAKHHRRTDRLLTLSEDLPLVSIAVDAPPKIDALAAEIAAIDHVGLLTVERLRIPDARATGPLSADGGPATNDESVKLTVYLGRHERIDGQPAFAAVCRLLHERGVAGATVMLGVDGTREGARERARFFARNTHVPMMVMAVGGALRIDEAVSDLRQALPRSLLTIERVTVCKRDGEMLQAPADGDGRAPGTDLSIGAPASTAPDAGVGQPWQKLTIVTSEAARHEGKPVYLELIRRLRAAHAAGATSLRGIWGFHGDHAPHGDRLLSIRRHVPVVTDVIDTSERIAALFPIVDELTRERGLVTTELLPRPPIAGRAGSL